MNQFKPLGGARKRDCRRKDNGTREGFTLRCFPIAHGWEAHLETDDGDMYYGDGQSSEPGSACNAAYRAMLEATGRTRTLGHGKGRAAV